MIAARWGAMAVVALWAAVVRAQGEAADERDPVRGAPATAGEETVQACIALLNGEQPRGVDATVVRPRCEAMIRAASGAPEPAIARSAPASGTQVLAAFEQAGRELVGSGERRPLGLGATNRGDARSLLTTNPIGWFSGLGVNATLSRALGSYPKLSLVGSARYARANASNGNVTSVGLGAGADFFIVGRNNEGLRLGPRLDVSFGNESFGGTTTYGRAGLSGEIGYNFIATNGMAVLGAVGLGGRIVGDEQNEDFTSFTGGEFGPYLKLGLGYGF